MSYSPTIHWRRNTSIRKDIDNADGFNNINLQGATQLAMIQAGVKDPRCPLHMLAGFENSDVWTSNPLLWRILLFTEHAVLPCECCEWLPVVYCCRECKHVVREQSSNKIEMSEELEDVYDPRPKGILAQYHNHYFMESMYEISYDIHQERHIATSPPQGSTYFEPQFHVVPTRPMPENETGDYFFMDESGVYSFRSRTLLWEQSHGYHVSVTPDSFSLTRIGELKKNYSNGSFSTSATRLSRAGISIDFDRVFKDGFRHASLTINVPDSTDNIQVKYYAREVMSIHVELGPVIANNIYTHYHRLQRQFRAKSWLGQIAQKNPQHLQELYEKTSQATYFYSPTRHVVKRLLHLGIRICVVPVIHYAGCI